MPRDRFTTDMNDAYSVAIVTTGAPVAPTRERDRMPDRSAATMETPTGLLRATRDARQALREAAFAAEAAANRARSVAEVLDETLAVLVAAGSVTSPPSPAPSSPTTDRLSAREREVLLLVAEGHSNKAIAETLYVSPNTVKTHVASLLNKLDADNRAQLAAIATTHGVHPPHRDRRNDYAASHQGVFAKG